MAEVNWSLGLAPNYSDAFRYREAGQANRQQQDELQRQAQQRAALTAYARDPQAGLSGVIETDPRLGIALQDQQLQQRQAQQAQERAAQERALKAKMSLASALLHTPKDAPDGQNRLSVFQGLAPILPDVDQATIDQLAPRINDDNFLRGLSGQYQQQLEFINLGDGTAVALDKNTGREVNRYQAPRRVTLGEGQTLVEVPPSGAQAQPSMSADQVQSTIESLVPGVRVTSAQRTPEHNRAVGGAANSYHLSGNALDLVPPPGMTMAQLASTLRNAGLPTAELLNEGDHVHVAWKGQQQPQGARVVAQGAPKPEMTAYQREQLARQDRADARQQETAGRQVRGEVARIRSTFNSLPEVKAFNDVTSAYSIVKDLGARQKPTAADDISMVFSYMKMLDPGSAVREGEFANAQNAAGIPDRVANAYNRALRGNLLNPKQRQEFTQSAETIYRSRRPEYDRLVQEYQGYTEAAGGTRNDIQARPTPGSTRSRGPGVSFQPNQAQAQALRGFNGQGPRGAATNPVILNPQDPSSSYGNVKSGQYFVGPDGQLRKKP